MRPEKLWKYVVFSSLIFQILPGTAWAAPTIYDVVNYGSRIGSGLPGSGIARGALFAVTGAGVGPDQPLQASFPLPTTDGLGGVTITITAGATTVNGIMVYVAASEVVAILPSSTPLGSATVKVNSNGATASFPITVVASAFGIFANAGAFNVAPDGTSSANNAYQSAQEGQTVLISGTGLGAITSDETQSGATDIPNASITVWVGSTKASVVSAGRGMCCGGIDPNFPIPQGVAAWDVIALTIPSGVQGCQVSIAVQNGAFVSNFFQIAVAQGGGTCPEATGFNGGNPFLISGQVKTSVIMVLHLVVSQTIGTAAISTVSDSATAAFVPADFGPNTVQVPSYSANLKASVGSCFVVSSRFDRSIPIVVTPPTGPPSARVTLLDAGPALHITAPKVSQAMKNLMGVYNATAIAISIPGVPSGGGDTPFLLPGPYTLDNGSGGADIGAFTATLRNPTPVNWDNMAQVANVNRAQGVMVKWSGGDPDGVIVIAGSSSGTQGTVTYSGLFGCYAQASAGQFTVPPFVTQQLPPSGTPAQGGSGVMNVTAIIADNQVMIPGIDLTTYFSQQAVGTTVVFQ